jgi:hypothetical protein
MNYIIRVALLLASVVVMAGCTGTKKYAGFVKRHYSKTDTTTHKSNLPISLVVAIPSRFDTLVSVRKGESWFIPALLYWGTKETFHCELNAAVPSRIINNTFLQYADSSGLTGKLHGRRLELTIESLPTRFFYSATTDVYVLIIYAFTTTHQSITPEKSSMVLSWKLYDGQEVVKKGQVSSVFYSNPLINNLKSMRKITWAYLDRYDQTISEMSTECLMQLVNAL